MSQLTPNHLFHHQDFIWDSNGAKDRVYPLVLKALVQYPPRQPITISSSSGPPGP